MVNLSTDRIARLAAELKERNWDVFLAWSPVSMGYLGGFFESSHERFMSLFVSRSGQDALICPSLSEAQARRVGLQNIRSWSDSQDPYALVRQLALDWGFSSGTIALDMAMPAHMVLRLQESLPESRFVIGQDAISALRSCKQEVELEYMRRASQIVDESLQAAYAAIRPGVSELEIQRVLQREITARGGEPTFCCVAIGPGSAEPHHVTNETRAHNGDIILMDFGCEFRRYQSDITRVVCCGDASDEMKKVYGIVYEAHMAARRAIRVGVPCEGIDQAARSVIDRAGYGDKFFHRVGHGIGMEVHEEPYMVAGNTAELKLGNCFSIEPGIYLEGNFGVRIENLVAVTESGHESFNQEPSPNLIEVRA